MRYIKREKEYKEVINNIEVKIEDNSTKPLQILEEKTADELLANGKDIHDKEVSKELQRLKELSEKNQIMFDHVNGINPTQKIKEIKKAMEDIDDQIEEKKNEIGDILKGERQKIMIELDKKLTEIKEMIRKENEKKKDD